MSRWDYPSPLQPLPTASSRFYKQPTSPTSRIRREECPAEDIFADLFNSRPSSDQRQLGVGTRMVSRSSAVAPIDHITLAASAMSAGFRRLEDKTPAAELDLPSKPVSLDTLAPASLKNYVVTQLNQMYAYMEQAMTRERARHSSDVKLMLRKVDKDLKDTFRAVRETFVSLTDQVQQLLEEVETGKKMMKDVQAKFEVASRAAQVRAQYVEELEAVLDGQVPNISQAMRKLTEELTISRQAVEQAKKDAEATAQAVLQEKTMLEDTIRSLEERLNQADNPAGEMKGAVELPIMQEMAATWTRRVESNSPDAASPLHVDIVGSTLAKCDATRAVMRTKRVRPLRTRSTAAPLGGKGRFSNHRPRISAESEDIADMKRRTKEAEQRVVRQQQLILQATPSLQLVRDIFSELRLNWRLPMGAQAEIYGSSKDLKQSAKAPDILDRIVQLFLGAFQNLGKFSEILDMMCEEATRPVAQLFPTDADGYKDNPDVSDRPIELPADAEGETEAFPCDDVFAEEDFLAPLIPTPKRRQWGAGSNLPNLVEEPAFTKRSFSPR